MTATVHEHEGFKWVANVDRHKLCFTTTEGRCCCTCKHLLEIRSKYRPDWIRKHGCNRPTNGYVTDWWPQHHPTCYEYEAK